jgi:hypothetical protein
VWNTAWTLSKSQVRNCRQPKRGALRTLDSQDFYEQLMNDVRARAEIDNDFTESAFLNELIDRLVDAEVVSSLTPVHFTGSGTRNRRLALSAYEVDESELRRRRQSVTRYGIYLLPTSFSRGRPKIFLPATLRAFLLSTTSGTSRGSVVSSSRPLVGRILQNRPKGMVAGRGSGVYVPKPQCTAVPRGLCSGQAGSRLG